MTTTTKKKTGRSNKAATTKTTKKSTKPTKPDISLIENSPEERWKVIAVAACPWRIADHHLKTIT
jgi:hypothetical protein